MTYQIKICGIKNIKFINICIKAKADFIGFVNFPKSPRHVNINKLSILIKNTPKIIKSVVLTVNATLEHIKKIASLKPDYIQLHGQEDVNFCNKIKFCSNLKIIKAISIKDKNDLLYAHHFENHVDILLFDTKPTKNNILPGGNGKSFNWLLLNKKKFKCKTMLAGGLNSKNIKKAINQSSIKMLDVSSSVEISRGIKNKKLIEKFIKKIKG